MKIERLVGDGRMEEAETPAVGFQTPAQIVPSPDLVHGFVLDQPFQDGAGAAPIDRSRAR